jgi:hypothetical protein
MLFFPCGFQVFLSFASQFHESGSQADVFVHRIAVIVSRNHLGSPLVRHGGGNLIERGAEQISSIFCPGNSSTRASSLAASSSGNRTAYSLAVLAGAAVFFHRSSKGLNFTNHSAIADYCK